MFTNSEMNINKILPLLKESPYLTKQNLAVVLGISNDALDYWIKKLINERYLIPLKKGFYITSYYLDLVGQTDKEGYFEYLANLLRAPSYVSLEYVLSKANIIPEGVYTITSITTKSSRTYTSSAATFTFKNIKEELFFGFEIRSFRGKQVKIATPPKALFDFLYLKPRSSSKNSRINWDALEKRQKTEFKEIVKRSKSKKMALIAAQL